MYKVKLQWKENECMAVVPVKLSEDVNLEQARQTIQDTLVDIPDFDFIYKNIKLKSPQEKTLKCSRVAAENIITIILPRDTEKKLFSLEFDIREPVQHFFCSTLKLSSLKTYVENKYSLRIVTFIKKGLVLSKKQENIYCVANIAELKNNVLTISIRCIDQVDEENPEIHSHSFTSSDPTALENNLHNDIIEISDNEEICQKTVTKPSEISFFSSAEIEQSHGLQRDKLIFFNTFRQHNKLFLEKKEQISNASVVYGIVDTAWTITKTDLLLNVVKNSPPSSSVLKWVDKMNVLNTDLKCHFRKLEDKNKSTKKTKALEDQIDKIITSLKLAQNNLEKALDDNRLIKPKKEEDVIEEEIRVKPIHVSDEEIETLIKQIKRDFEIEQQE